MEQMSMTVHEVCRLTGVTIRTLHYYDEIGLLSPCIVMDNGYRYYDETSLDTLQQILFYRELDFSLKDIKDIMNAENYVKTDAMIKQKNLLTLKKKRLEQLISLLEINIKGEKKMSFKEFDMSEIDKTKEEYADEVKNRWGKTAAYEQSRKKTGKYTKEDWASVMEKSDAIMKEFAAHITDDPHTDAVQELVKKWQDYITETYYDCTNEILQGLGQMYVADERFTKNIDKFGIGTAKLMSEAIQIYCLHN